MKLKLLDGCLSWESDDEKKEELKLLICRRLEKMEMHLNDIALILKNIEILYIFTCSCYNTCI